MVFKVHGSTEIGLFKSEAFPKIVARMNKPTKIFYIRFSYAV